MLLFRESPFAPFSPRLRFTGKVADGAKRLGPMMTTGFDEIEKTFNVTADQISFSLVGLLQITTGSSTFFTAAAAAV